MTAKSNEGGAPPRAPAGWPDDEPAGPLTAEELDEAHALVPALPGPWRAKFVSIGASHLARLLYEVRMLRAIEKAARDYDEQGENCTMGYRPCSHCDAREALQRLLGTAEPARSDSGRPPDNEIAAQVRRDNGED